MFYQEFTVLLEDLDFVNELKDIQEVNSLEECGFDDVLPQEFKKRVLIDLKMNCSLIDYDIPIIKQASVDFYNWFLKGHFCDPHPLVLDAAWVVRGGQRRPDGMLTLEVEVVGTCKNCDAADLYSVFDLPNNQEHVGYRLMALLYMNLMEFSSQRRR
jgi:hypothetical protein